MMLMLGILLGSLLLSQECSAFSTGGSLSTHHDIQSRLGRCTSSTSRTLLRVAKPNELSPEEREVAMEKATKAMTAFTNKYLENTCTKLCSDKSVPAVVIKGLAEHKVSLGAPLCPCRFYDDKEKEVKDGYWNCPCVPMRERHECHCMLFLTDDNAFAGEETSITFDEVVEASSGLD